MSNRNYYYLISSLPKLRLDDYKEHYRLDNYIADLKKHLTEEHLYFVQGIVQNKERGLSAANADDIAQQQFYLKMTTSSNEFIRSYFTFDRDLRNVLVALNKRKFNLDTDGYVGEQEDDVIHNLKISSLSDFGLSWDLSYVPALIDHFQSDDIVSFERYVDQLRWETIDSINTFKYFAIDVLLGYLVKFMLVERWLSLDVQSGDEIFKDRTKVSLATA
ncbi:DUF2764 family protein [Candidatus Omnitrophota bacterium]